AGLLARLLGPRGAVPRRLHQLAERRRDRHHGERNGANTVWGTLHCGVSPGGPCNETSGIGGNRACPGATCQSAFHTYAIEWDRSVSPQQIRWYVDGQQYHQVSQTQVDGVRRADARRLRRRLLLQRRYPADDPAPDDAGWWRHRVRDDPGRERQR